MALSQVLPLIGITVDSEALKVTIQTLVSIVGGVLIYLEHRSSGNRTILGGIKKA